MTDVPRMPGPRRVTRAVRASVDPARLYQQLCDGGRRRDTVLFESAALSTRLAERSLIVAESAARVVCRGRRVAATAVGAGGRAAIERLATALASTAAISERNPQGFVATFPTPPAGLLDDRQRLAQASPLDAVRQLATCWQFAGDGPELHTAGVLAYDLVDLQEALPPAARDLHGYPDFVFRLPAIQVVVHHLERRVTVTGFDFGGDANGHLEQRIGEIAALCAELDGEPPLGPGPCATPSAAGREDGTVAVLGESVDQCDAEFARLVDQLKEPIREGRIFQIVPSRRFSAPCPDPFAAYLRLRMTNPSPYMFYVQGAEGTLLGASPETYVKVSAPSANGDGTRVQHVELRPIAGTRPRGLTAAGEIDRELDERLEVELRLCAKETAEHLMLVDLARNDVARVSRPGTRRVDKLLTVERYSRVMHLVTTVRGELAPELDALHAYAAVMNMGTLVGAPKGEAARILRAVEVEKRGPYGGAVGVFSSDGAFDSAIVIRSALVQDGVAHVRAGAGVVYDSDPEAEARETRHKADAVRRVLA